MSEQEQEQGQQDSAFRFEGRWQDYAPIAFTNLLLTIVTLGIYRFWATTRTRHYLWSRTQFIDEPLEWTGTGKELLVGFLLVAVLFGIPFLALNFGAQALVLQGHAGIAGLLGIASFLLIFYLTGVARFRALRYRLSRSYWHGIRGGSDDAGFGYGWSWMWKSTVGSLPLGLLIPWSMTTLWNDRWNRMSFGSQTFRSEAEGGRIFKRFLLFYLAPILFVVIGIGVAVALASGVEQFKNMGAAAAIAAIFFAVLFIFGIYILLGLVALAYYAAFLRETIGHVSLGEIDFHFGATTWQWLKLFFGDVALVICTIGIGALFLTYRHWKFFITHLEATGEVSLSALGQSTTREPRQGEGLLDAFDIGAI
ncbi:MAG TPA: YjgN family protein [Sphingobium sp.]